MRNKLVCLIQGLEKALNSVEIGVFYSSKEKGYFAQSPDLVLIDF
tara:strand:- start:723 stop:857 length:135 start_codon:yes stop_codon:yes gene_type:complete